MRTKNTFRKKLWLLYLYWGPGAINGFGAKNLKKSYKGTREGVSKNQKKSKYENMEL